jgi:hypothetical protein
VDGATDRPILCLATQGHGHLDEQRILALLEPLEPRAFAFDRAHKPRSALALLRAARHERPRLIVMEGTGIAGGLAVLTARALLGVPYVVSSGDAVGPYLGLRGRLPGFVGTLYERLLCRRCAGFIGWTPYLEGRALTFGAPRAMCAPGWARGHAGADARGRVRAALGIREDAIVAGLVGSLQRGKRTGYAYGAELIRAVRSVSREDVAVCIVGDGSALDELRELAGEDLGRRVFLPGRVTPEQVPDHLAAFDVASLPQSVDGVGAFRYSTKLSEYLDAGLPILTGRIPAAYDLDEGQIVRLPGPAPWSDVYIGALAAFLEDLSAERLSALTEAAAGARERGAGLFSLDAQRARVCAFVTELLEDEATG